LGSEATVDQAAIRRPPMRVNLRLAMRIAQVHWWLQ
jgi:hypothetical protein